MKNNNDVMFTFVKGTRVYWDEDHDERVIPIASALIDAVEYRFGYNPILAVEEHEATLIVIVDSFAVHVEEKPTDLLRSSEKGFIEILEKLVGDLTDAVVGDYWCPKVHVVKEVPYRSHEFTFPFLRE